MDANFFYGDNVVHRASLVPEGEEPDENETVRIKYVDARPPAGTLQKGVILLIHGFPQTSYQYRKVIPLLTQAGYRLMVPDYRGAGHSSKPVNLRSYLKTRMATDLHYVIKTDLKISEPIHVIGHDNGGKIAHAYATLFPSDTASIVWGEDFIPGTASDEQAKETVQL